MDSDEERGVFQHSMGLVPINGPPVNHPNVCQDASPICVVTPWTLVRFFL